MVISSGPLLKSVLSVLDDDKSPEITCLPLFSIETSSIFTRYHFTLASSTSTLSVVKNHPRQNQSRSTAVAFSSVLNKSPGLGCLYFQRLAYSLKAASNRSRPITVSLRI